MEFAKSFDPKQINAQIEAHIDTVVDQIQKGTETVLGFVQPEPVRKTLADINSAYFNLARSSLDNVKEFNSVVAKINEEFVKSVEKNATKYR